MHMYRDLASRMSIKQMQLASTAGISALLSLAHNSNRWHAGTGTFGDKLTPSGAVLPVLSSLE